MPTKPFPADLVITLICEKVLFSSIEVKLEWNLNTHKKALRCFHRHLRVLLFPEVAIHNKSPKTSVSVQTFQRTDLTALNVLIILKGCCIRWPMLPWHVCTHSTCTRQATLWLSKEQPGGGTSPLCMCSHQSRVKEKKVIKQTIYQALCVCLSMNIPFLHSLNTHQPKIEERRKKRCFIVFPECGCPFI